MKLATSVNGIRAQRLERGFRPSAAMSTRRTAFRKAQAAIERVRKAEDMLETVRRLRRYTFAYVRCERVGKNFKYWCTPENLASEEDVGNVTESESEAELVWQSISDVGQTYEDEAEIIASGSDIDDIDKFKRIEGTSAGISYVSTSNSGKSASKAAGSNGSPRGSPSKSGESEVEKRGSGSDSGGQIQAGKEQEISHEAFEELFGEDVCVWVTKRAATCGRSSLTKEHAQIVGLTEAKRIEYSGTKYIVREEHTGFGGEYEDIPMVVSADRIFFFSGDPSVQKGLPKGAELIDLQPRCFYGSTMDERRNSTADGTAEWHMLLMYTLKRHGNQDKADIASDPHDDEVTVSGGADGQIECTLSSEHDHSYLDRIVSQCIRRPNEVWRSDNPWSRPPSSTIRRYFVYSERTFCRSGTFECAKCAVINGIAILSGREYASNLALETGRMEVRHLMDLSKEVRSNAGNFSLNWKMNPQDWDKNKKYTATWLCTVATGVLIVNLIGSGGFNHMICVDARTSNKKKIYDGLEEHPVWLCEESINCCIGDGIELTHIYVRKLTKNAGLDRALAGKRKRPTNRNARRKAARAAAK